MRFSTIFQIPVPHRPDAPAAEPARSMVEAAPAPAREIAPELPDDLDQRVRLIGEWQLGEG